MADIAPATVHLVGAGPGDPELLTIKAVRLIRDARLIVHDGLVADEIMAMARPDARLISVAKKRARHTLPQEDINALIVKHAKAGAQVVRLKSGDPTVFGRLDEELDACNDAGIGWNIVPGITAASASVASIGQSLTRRGRNASVRFLTGHDMKGFADHDWKILARSGEVAAIYMGKKAARFIQGRLIMHGADPATPVTIIENASRADQRVLPTTLANLAHDIAEANLSGPALTLYGLAPRSVDAVLSQIKTQEFA